MKTIAIETETRRLADWLPPEDQDEIVTLTQGGKARFLVVPFDEGDAEALAVANNEPLMKQIMNLIERARRGKTYALEEIRRELELDSGT